MIHVCYSMSDYSGKYCKWTGTSVLSMFENTREQITVHLLTDSTLTQDSRQKLIQICKKYNQQIKFYDAGSLAENWWKQYRALKTWKTFRPGIGSAYRLAAPMLIPNDVHKLLFIDSDIVVDLDIAELWNFDLKGNPIGGVSLFDMGTDSAKRDRISITGAIPFKEYINSGTLILDLDQIRKSGSDYILSNCLKILQKHDYISDLHDERALSILYLNRYTHLPKKFNWMVGLARGTKKFSRGNMYHFAGSKMLNLNTLDRWNELFFSYFIKTPFCNPEVFENLFDECVRLFDESQRSVEQRLQTMQHALQLKTANRQSLFYIDPKLEDKVKKVFEIKKVEPRVFSTAEASQEILLYTMKHNSSQYIFYICLAPNDYLELRKSLETEGFKENLDFFNGFEIFSPAAKRLPSSADQFAIM